MNEIKDERDYIGDQIGASVRKIAPSKELNKIDSIIMRSLQNQSQEHWRLYASIMDGYLKLAIPQDYLIVCPRH